MFDGAPVVERILRDEPAFHGDGRLRWGVSLEALHLLGRLVRPLADGERSRVELREWLSRRSTLVRVRRRHPRLDRLRPALGRLLG